MKEIFFPRTNGKNNCYFDNQLQLTIILGVNFRSTNVEDLIIIQGVPNLTEEGHRTREHRASSSYKVSSNTR